jgi:hypothetical protein
LSRSKKVGLLGGTEASIECVVLCVDPGGDGLCALLAHGANVAVTKCGWNIVTMHVAAVPLA